MEHESKQLALEAFQSALVRAGSQSAFARICGCTPPNIAQLLDRGSVLPAKYVLKVEKATGVSRHDLRPDLYPRDLPPAPDADSAEDLAA